MRKLKLILATLALMLGWSNASAQGTWTAPEVPGVNPLELTSSDEVYLYNIGADAFVNYGMNWNRQAIATRLLSGDETASSRHLMTVTVPDGNTTIKMSLKDFSNKTIFCGAGTTNDIYVDNTYNNVWTPAASAKYSNAYTLNNTTHSKNLDVQWLYGGRLTLDGGQGFTDWAFIPAASITDGSYAKYKERKQMYDIYKELDDNDKVSTYSSALATANAVYTNASATKAELRAATRTLLIAVADGIENPVNANALFTNADILGNNTISDWGNSFNVTNGVFERYHAKYTLNQSQTDLPNGLYDVTFHGLWRQDDGKSQAAPHLTVTGSNVLEDDLKTINTLQSKWSVANGNRNSGQWTAEGLPNHQIPANQAMTLGDAIAAINNVQVKGNSLTIQLAITGENQWVLFQGFDIIYNGPINVAVYKRLMEKKTEAEALVGSPMEASVLSTLQTCIYTADGLTANSDESDLNDAYDNLVAAIASAQNSIAYTAHVTAITDNNGDITSLINGNFTDNADGWTGGSRITGLARGWSSPSAENPFYERSSDGTMSYTLSNMPAGTYKVVAAARSYDGGKIKAQVAGGEYGAEMTGTGDGVPADGTMEINLNGVEMPYSSLGGFTSNDNGHNWHWITATGTLAEAGNLVINFVTTGNSWMPIDDVHLYCTNLDGTSYTRTVGDGGATINTSSSVVTTDIILDNPNTVLRTTGAITTAAGQNMNNDQYNSARITKLVLYDGYNFTKLADEVGSDNGAVLYRNIPADTWCTLVVPFWPTTTLTMKYPTSFADGTLTFSDVDRTTWNGVDKPMLIKSATAITAIEGKLASTNGGGSGINHNDMTSGVGVPMTGVYANGYVPVSTSDTYYYAIDSESNLLRKVAAENGISIAPFRAYFTLNKASGARNFINLNFGDETTEISQVKDGQFINEGIIYNLRGQRVSNPAKGLYIMNGKKVIIK
jgi:hypothetical protein